MATKFLKNSQHRRVSMTKTTFLMLLLSLLNIQCLRRRESLEKEIVAQEDSDQEESLSPIVKPDVDAIRKVSRDYLKKHPDNPKDALIKKDVKKLVKKFANSSDRDWKKFLESPAFSNHLDSHDLLTKGQTSSSDRSQSKSPGRLSQKGLITILSLATVATAANLGVSLSFVRANGYLCIYNKALLAGMGLSSATLTFLAVAMQLEKPGKDFDKVIAKLGIGAGALIATQALGTGIFSAFFPSKNTHDHLKKEIKSITGKKKLKGTEVEKILSKLKEDRRYIFTADDEKIIREYLLKNLSYKIPKKALNKNAKEAFEKINTPQIPKDQLGVLNQLLDAYITGARKDETISKYFGELDETSRSSLVDKLKKASKPKEAETAEDLIVKKFNQVRSSMKSYLGSKDKSFLFKDEYINYVLDYIELSTYYKIPPAVLAGEYKPFPKNRDQWKAAIKKSWEMRAEYKLIKGPMHPIEAGEINYIFAHQRRAAHLARAKIHSVMASVLGLSAGIAIMATAAAAKGPLGLAEQDDLESFFREIGIRASRIQDLAQQI